MPEKQSKSLAGQTVVVILAAGKGTRMGSRYMAKVCFEIDGVSAINRLVLTFKKKYFTKFLVVVGSMAEQVLDTIGQMHQNVMFVYQPEQLGTGHASRIAANALQKLGHTGPVLLTMGDKYVEPKAVKMLVEGFVEHKADLVLLTVPQGREQKTSSGRVLVDKSGRAAGIIERTDLARQAIIDELRLRLKKGQKISSLVIDAAIQKHINNPKKRAFAVPELLALVNKAGRVNKAKLKEILSLEKYNLVVDGKYYTARQIRGNCTQFNPSLYLFKAQAFYKGISMIDNNNAQREYYLTDVVKHLSGTVDESGNKRYEVKTVSADDPDVVRGFNSLIQLVSIKDY
ncbi:MAG: NTP transferase domain-containing protein [Planctomycetota bacterium]|jgi:bifunctional N-acetylglucosamine-1-phosphate-uridyltransferase/glucosamine-1-phosphate-acetyltransferase GlmU-like protein